MNKVRSFSVFVLFLLFVFGAQADKSDSNSLDPELLKEISSETGLPVGVFPHAATEAQKKYVRQHRDKKPDASKKSSPLPPPAAGYRAPGEFEPSAAFIVSTGEWGFSSMLEDMIVAGTAEGGAPVIVLTSSAAASCEGTLLQMGVGADRGRCVTVSGIERKWTRDFGPLSIYENTGDGNLSIVDLNYYGGDWYPSANTAPSVLANTLGFTTYRLEGQTGDEYEFDFEGGNYITDGAGTCIMSNDVWSDNAEWGNTDADTQAEVETICSKYLGCQKFIWLQTPPSSGGFATGHADLLQKLITPLDMVVMDGSSWDSTADANAATLQASTNLSGESFIVHRIQMSGVYTYSNALQVNKVLMVPTYNSSYDEPALQAYRNILGSEHTVVGIPSSSLINEGGAVHCTTMQLASACGNGKIDTLLWEECDSDNLNGQTCETLGEEPGDLKCTADFCKFDTSLCGVTDVDTDTDSDSDSDSDSDTDSDDDSDDDDDNDDNDDNDNDDNDNDDNDNDDNDNDNDDNDDDESDGTSSSSSCSSAPALRSSSLLPMLARLIAS